MIKFKCPNCATVNKVKNYTAITEKSHSCISCNKIFKPKTKRKLNLFLEYIFNSIMGVFAFFMLFVLPYLIPENWFGGYFYSMIPCVVLLVIYIYLVNLLYEKYMLKYFIQ
jgi:uncharacterized C2H2 Zn-finger protein